MASPLNELGVNFSYAFSQVQLGNKQNCFIEAEVEIGKQVDNML